MGIDVLPCHGVRQVTCGYVCSSLHPRCELGEHGTAVASTHRRWGSAAPASAPAPPAAASPPAAPQRCVVSRPPKRELLRWTAASAQTLQLVRHLVCQRICCCVLRPTVTCSANNAITARGQGRLLGQPHFLFQRLLHICSARCKGRGVGLTPHLLPGHTDVQLWVCTYAALPPAAPTHRHAFRPPCSGIQWMRQQGPPGALKGALPSWRCLQCV